jgi:hypothetical protein
MWTTTWVSVIAAGAASGWSRAADLNAEHANAKRLLETIRPAHD